MQYSRAVLFVSYFVSKYIYFLNSFKTFLFYSHLLPRNAPPPQIHRSINQADFYANISLNFASNALTSSSVKAENSP